MPGQPPVPVEPRPSRAQLGVLIASCALVAVVLVADLQGSMDGSRTPGMVLAIAGAAVVAGVTYSFWAGSTPRTLRMHVALLTAMIGGATVAASASGGTDGVFSSVTMALVGLAGLLVSVVALLAQARATGAGAPTPSPKGTR
ncbi:hypothetical protein RDV89_02650 [Nocardioides zeae]|uniref:Uncharacterized protein n=1 Tax=Nocardioides imazamoxiresistens TaxID=3231893 RepID=A0ABU3PRV0_9ACTN|nr:hypothetical protein [Nocardioides zeae]MDT9591948.1 hypothetical protein [Nocardioides zeae]